MEQITEFAKDVVDRYIKSMGYNPQTIDRNKRMALTKTARFQQFAQRMQEEMKLEESKNSRRKEMSKSARMIKAIYKKHRVVKEELYDHEKDDKDGGTYGKKPKFAKNDTDNVKDGETGENKAKAAAVLSGGTTLTGQKRDDVEFDPVLNKPNIQTDTTGVAIKANKKDK